MKGDIAEGFFLLRLFSGRLFSAEIFLPSNKIVGFFAEYRDSPPLGRGRGGGQKLTS